MIRVWKCDFCSKTSTNSNNIEEHEPKCLYNPINKTCYTCEYRYSYYESELCELKLDRCEGQEGNCSGWLSDDPNELRKLKIEKICKNLVKD